MNSEKNMECSLEDLESYLDGMPYYVFMLDECEQYKYMNKSFEKIINKRKEEIQNKKNYNVLDKNLFKQIKNNYINVPKNEKVTIKENKYNINDKEYWYEEARIKFLHDENTLGLDEHSNEKKEWKACICRQITVKKNIEKIIKKYISTSLEFKENYQNCSEKKYNSIIIDMINNLKKSISCSGMVLYLYNEKKNAFYEYINDGINNKVSTFINDRINKCLKNKSDVHIECLEKEYENRYGILDNNKFIISRGIYFGEKIIGALFVNYDNFDNSDTYKRYKEEKFINTTCNELGVIIKTKTLNKELILEIKRRKESKKNLEQFIETATDLCAIAKVKDNKVFYENITDSWKMELGWSKEDLNAMDFTMLLEPKEANNIVRAIKRSMIIGKLNVNRAKILCKNDKYKFIEWRWKMIDEETVVITGSDKTEEQKLEDEKKRLEHTINLENLKRKFFNNMSFEFKTPLNVILSTIQLLQLYSQNDDSYESFKKASNYVNGIKNNSYRLLKLVNDLIDLSKIDSGYYELNIKNHNIVDEVENIVDYVNSYFGERISSIIFDTNEEEVLFACDLEKIEKLILNILNSTIKYTDKNDHIQVDIHTDKLHKYVEITIKNNKSIITDEYLKEICKVMKKQNKFIYEDNVMTSITLRLSLIESLVKLHGGELILKDNLKSKLETTIKLPINVLNNGKSNSENKFINDKSLNSSIEKCNIEFSEIS